MKETPLVANLSTGYPTGRFPVTRPAGNPANIPHIMDQVLDGCVPVIVIQDTGRAPAAIPLRYGTIGELHDRVRCRQADVTGKPHGEVLPASTQPAPFGLLAKPAGKAAPGYAPV